MVGKSYREFVLTQDVRYSIFKKVVHVVLDMFVHACNVVLFTMLCKSVLTVSLRPCDLGCGVKATSGRRASLASVRYSRAWKCHTRYSGRLPERSRTSRRGYRASCHQNTMMIDVTVHCI